MSQSRKRADTDRPTAKTAARKAFDFYFGEEPVGGWRFDQSMVREKVWRDWQAAWRTARGCRPTKREDAQ